jgi:hypothetical protein
MDGLESFALAGQGALESFAWTVHAVCLTLIWLLVVAMTFLEWGRWFSFLFFFFGTGAMAFLPSGTGTMIFRNEGDGFEGTGGWLFWSAGGCFSQPGRSRSVGVADSRLLSTF